MGGEKEMKIRNGFVSNSSSSSFIIATTIQNHQKVMDQLNEIEKSVVNAIMNQKSKFCGFDLIVGECVSSEDFYTLCELNIDIEEDKIYSIWDKYKVMVNKNKEEVFSYSIDM